MLPHNIQRQLAGLGHGDPVGNGHHPGQTHRHPLLQRGRECCRPLGLHPNHSGTGTGEVHGSGHPCEQPPASRRDDDGRDLRHLLQNLKAQSGLAGDDVNMIKGWNKNTAACGRLVLCQFDGLRQVFPDQTHLGAIAAGRSHFWKCSPGRHEYDAINPQLACSHSCTLGMVASAGRYHSPLALRFA